ncbi:hypothetical protein Dimus_036226 [Dionaea muscipula]
MENRRHVELDMGPALLNWSGDARPGPAYTVDYWPNVEVNPNQELTGSAFLIFKLRKRCATMEQREGSTSTGGAERATGDRPPKRAMGGRPTSRRWVVGDQRATASVPKRANASVPRERQRRCRASDSVGRRASDSVGAERATTEWATRGESERRRSQNQ